MKPWKITRLCCLGPGGIRPATWSNDRQVRPQSIAYSNTDVLEFIENWKIYSSGIGLIDAHLLASTALQATILFTFDKPLIRVAKLCKISIY